MLLTAAEVKIRGTVNPADLMTKHLDGKRLMRLCDLLNKKRISGRQSSAPKLMMDTEYISRAPRAVVAITMVRQAGANEIAVPSGAEYETWIDERRTDYWTMAGWITVVIVACCILMSQYISHMSKLCLSTSCAIKNHSGVRTCRVAETRGQQFPR